MSERGRLIGALALVSAQELRIFADKFLERLLVLVCADQIIVYEALHGESLFEGAESRSVDGCER